MATKSTRPITANPALTLLLVVLVLLLSPARRDLGAHLLVPLFRPCILPVLLRLCPLWLLLLKLLFLRHVDSVPYPFLLFLPSPFGAWLLTVGYPILLLLVLIFLLLLRLLLYLLLPQEADFGERRQLGH